MSTLSKQEILQKIGEGWLILNPLRNEQGIPALEHASYDLRAGIAIWKHDGKKSLSKACQSHYDPNLSESKQPVVTLQPGHMMFVISQEELKIPKDTCGTVFSRNSLSRAGILALNAGHIDPGYQGHIIIRLINLRSTPYSLKLGSPIYTIVFNKLLYSDENSLSMHESKPLNKTIEIVLESANSALSNALYDLALLSNFVKKEEFGRAYWGWLKKSFWGLVTILFAIFGAFAAIFKIMEHFK
jgi:deoxycytidine triphosphate deaminase